MSDIALHTVVSSLLWYCIASSLLTPWHLCKVQGRHQTLRASPCVVHHATFCFTLRRLLPLPKVIMLPTHPIMRSRVARAAHKEDIDRDACVLATAVSLSWHTQTCTGTYWLKKSIRGLRAAIYPVHVHSNHLKQMFISKFHIHQHRRSTEYPQFQGGHPRLVPANMVLITPSVLYLWLAFILIRQQCDNFIKIKVWVFMFLPKMIGLLWTQIDSFLSPSRWQWQIWRNTAMGSQMCRHTPWKRNVSGPACHWHRGILKQSQWSFVKKQHEVNSKQGTLKISDSKLIEDQVNVSSSAASGTSGL